ncbi:hypothetical protein [Rhizobium sp. WYJ-E13]|uniref:hypothetical protein n=1 Tax=unclassified Rhizobium TaxID=2613769 RepID=UPI001C1F051F|nr:hypothetical protein [Rhizobium sp. WYJ-E13]QWW70961.1 hypothetical protein KQ933_29645 [Rhizobium sp. WYJ-E13]
MLHHRDTSRVTEALMSAAGCAPPSYDSRTNGDILLERDDADHWDIEIISPRAREWAASELCCPLRQCFAGRMRLDIMSADRLLKMAHDRGFRTEFVTRSGRDVF